MEKYSYHCICGYSSGSIHVLFKHIRRWGAQEPGRHTRSPEAPKRPTVGTAPA